MQRRYDVRIFRHNITFYDSGRSLVHRQAIENLTSFVYLEAGIELVEFILVCTCNKNIFVDFANKRAQIHLCDAGDRAVLLLFTF